jgi:guanosine-3',5'-bis(diphosphate) 3'-pyrophosphohydrolase
MTIARKRRPALDYARLLDAVHFAADKHRDQRRKDVPGSPYINHPIAVAEALVRIGGVTELPVLQAAVLHDTLEDTKTTQRELVARFGAKVAGIVAEVTDDKTLEKGERKRRQIEHTAQLSHAAKLVKLGDKICNVHDVLHGPPEKWDEKRRIEYIEWARRVVAGCLGANEALERHFGRLASGALRTLNAGKPTIRRTPPRT